MSSSFVRFLFCLITIFRRRSIGSIVLLIVYTQNNFPSTSTEIQTVLVFSFFFFFFLSCLETKWNMLFIGFKPGDLGNIVNRYQLRSASCKHNWLSRTLLHTSEGLWSSWYGFKIKCFKRASFMICLDVNKDVSFLLFIESFQ